MSEDKLLTQINKLKSFRDIGETFNYLGVTMLVIGHNNFSVGEHGAYEVACLMCHYKNDAGDIRNIEFQPFDLSLLIKLNKQ